MGGGECWPVLLASKLLWVGLSSPICPVWSHLSLWALKQEEGSGCLHGLQNRRLQPSVFLARLHITTRVWSNVSTMQVRKHTWCHVKVGADIDAKKTKPKAPEPRMSQSGCRMLPSPSNTGHPQWQTGGLTLSLHQADQTQGWDRIGLTLNTLNNNNT